MQFFLFTFVFQLMPPPDPPSATTLEPPPAAFSIASDAALGQLQRTLPKGWTMKINGDQLVIQSVADVWVLFENRINAPENRESEAQRIARIIKYGKKCPVPSRSGWRKSRLWQNRFHIEPVYAWSFCSSHAMFCPKVCMVKRPSSSCSTSPGKRPTPMFQYTEPTTIIWLIKK